MKRRTIRLMAIGLAFALVAAACGGDDSSDEATPVNFVLQWVTQAQFAGYFAAADQGFFAEEGVDVTIIEGGPDIAPQAYLASGQADIGEAWAPKALLAIEQDADIVNIAQVFQRGGTLEVSWADSGISSPADWAGKTVGVWPFGNEFEITAAVNKFGVSDVEYFTQGFDMLALLNREIDAAEAMIYNEYAQLLETENPDTGQLYQASDFNVIDTNDIGTAMLQDGVWARSDWLADNEDAAEAFLRAAFKGWIYCRDNFDACVDIVLARGSELGRSHQEWQLNEINSLIWPSPDGIGYMDQALWDQTADVATSEGILTAAPSDDSFTRDLVEKVLKDLEDEGFDVVGNGWQRRTIELQKGGN